MGGLTMLLILSNSRIIEGRKDLKSVFDHASPNHHLQVRLRYYHVGLA